MNVPAWQGVRGRDFLYVRNADGFEELYRSTDVFQLDNVASDPTAAHLLRRARAVFGALSLGAQG